MAGAARGSFNFRFAQPSRDGHPFYNMFYPTDIFPFTDLEETDPETGLTDGLLVHAFKDKVVPKIFYTNSAYEYWGRSASLIHISIDGQKDAPIPDTTRIYFLAGEVRATTDDDKLAAFGRGRDLGKLALEIAPRSEDAHVWYALNLGRWGQIKGMMRSLFLLPTIREELDTIFSINPRSVRGHALAGNLFFELPGMLGGDRKKAEEHFRKGIEADPHFTVLRLDLARLLVAEGRIAEARRELERVANETAPTNVADWTARDRPRARTRLDELRDRK